MAGVTLRVTYPKGVLSGYFLAREKDLAVAGKQAMAATGNDALEAGRRNIIAAGFPAATWGRAWHLKLYPKGKKPSLNATAFLANVIPYSGLFEEGGTQLPRKRSKLWLPFSSTPKLGGRRKTTPANYAAAGVKLFTAPFKTRRGKPILATVRAGKIQPLFFAADNVFIPKKFDLVRVTERAADNFPAHFAEAFANLKD